MSEVFLVSGNAGQGKTTTAKNLAFALREFGYDVLLVDGDPNTPKVCYHVGLPLADRIIQEVLLGKCSMNQAIYQKPSGLKVILSKHIPGAPHPAKLLPELRKSAHIVIIDVPTADSVWYATGCKTILVSYPDFPSVAEASRLTRSANVQGIILNRSYGAGADLSPGNIQEFTGLPVKGIIPDEPHCREALKHGHSILEFYPDATASITFKMIAAKLMNVEYVPPRRKAPLFAKLGLW